jgi:hypothetical protein
MGSANPERVPMKTWRGGCETVVQMIDQHWAVIGRCTRCQLKFEVDLSLIVRVSGPRTSLWNRTGRCKVVGCGGAVRFMGKPPRVTFFQDLEADWPEGVKPGTTGYVGPR